MRLSRKPKVEESPADEPEDPREPEQDEIELEEEGPWEELDDEYLDDADQPGEDLDEDVQTDEEQPDEEWPDEGKPDKDPSRSERTPASERLDALKQHAAGYLKKALAVWAHFWKRVGEIRLPRREIDGMKALAAGGIIVAALLIAAAGYLLGKGSGEDVDTARLQGEFAGRKAGAVAGATKGYAAGFKKGRDLAFRKSYAASYRRNYIRAYEDAGMDPPKARDIEVPKP